MANWRFGSVFRNSIPPPRPYKVPTFEEIFEKDHSSDIQESQSPNQFVLNLNSQNSKSTNQASSSHQQSKNMFKFSNFLTEHNRNSLKSPIVSETLSKLSKKDLLDEAFFESTTSKKVSEEDLRKKKLLEMAKEKLINKQKKKDQMIKAQQKQENYMKMMASQFSQKHQAKEPRSQDLDNFFSKVKDLSDASPSLKKKLQREVIKQYHDKMTKKSNQEEEYNNKIKNNKNNNKLLRWKQEQKRKDAKVSKINGQKFVDMSAGTVILDQSPSSSSSQSSDMSSAESQFSEMSQLASQSHNPFRVTPPSVMKENFYADTTVANGAISYDDFNDDPNDADAMENETENELKQNRKDDKAVMFTPQLCDKLRVPCRFVTEHPCCQLPQDIGMVARARSMDGSADLKWRFYQSRDGISSRGNRNKGNGRMLSGFRSGYNGNIPYNSWSSPTEIRTPKYFYDGGPDLTSTILSQCWRLTYLNCIFDREHPCCGLTNNSDSLANNVIDKWLRRY